MPRIDVSFKKTTRDMKLYLLVMEKEEKSDYIKDAIEFYSRYLEKKQKKNNREFN
ncbi:hypothetical protein N4T77_02585 [Clostridium sp. CX1]|uniref:hypothetical protein n=1 Tax=Clostridium sp. CX1 TaxID=2978346 RepID=UPI0021C16BF6|nr:hypothetical protein [Clostridium sp. CX1]MCT8975477.1 hypothetical protein [Clostridium sp. CX1]